MIEKGEYVHKIGENVVIIVSIFKPDIKRSNTEGNQRSYLRQWIGQYTNS